MYFKSVMFVTVLVALALTMVNSAASQVDVLKKEKVQSNSDREILYQKRIHNIHQDSSFYICSVHFEKISFKRDLSICLGKLDFV